MRKLRKMLLLLGAGSLLASACGGGATTQSGQSTSGLAASLTANDHTPLTCDKSITVDQLGKIQPPKANRRYKIALVEVSLAGYYYVATAYGAEQAAQAAGVDIVLVAAQGFSSVAQQITQVQDVLSRGIDALVLQPADVNGVAPAINAAYNRHIPVITIGTLANSDKAYELSQDDYTQGQMAADALAKLLPSGGSGVLMGGPANATWATRRVAGFHDQVTKYSNLNLIATTNQNVDPAEGLNKFINAMQGRNTLDWIYSDYVELLPPATVPPQFRGAKYIGGSWEPIMTDAISQGRAQIALPDFAVDMGFLGVTYAVEKLNGQSLPNLTCLPNATFTKDDLGSSLANRELYPAGWKPPVG